MKYVIMCGGIYPQWETPRHLTPIKGEPIVARTIRLLRECGVKDIAISANDKRFEGFGVPVLYHENKFKVDDEDSHWTDAFYPMDEPCCYLCGDVVFSKMAILKIVSNKVDDIQFYASDRPFDYRYIKEWAEPFAFKVVNQEHFKEAIRLTNQYQSEGKFKRQPVSWELWQVIRNTELNKILCNYCVINDYTCDIDKPEDVEKMEKVIPEDEV